MVPRTVQQPIGTVFRSVMLLINVVQGSNQLNVIYASVNATGLGIVV